MTKVTKPQPGDEPIEPNRCLCGAKAKLNTLRRGNYTREGDNFQVVCNRCRSRGPLVQDDPLEAVRGWNARNHDGNALA